MRARELCEQVGDPSQLFPTLYGLWSFYNMRADYKAAHEATNPLLALALRVEDPGRGGTPGMGRSEIVAPGRFYEVDLRPDPARPPPTAS